ncbi:AbrB/MazE/SpoVT family DNA-binding domain-containing protein [Paenibacillus pabuli]|uniref:AbrB/MazE/SpoVT family DNA-binding domain-containing protein n=1 Tax=Paenibacillus pabuli TaxID=1472 RepID=UPI0034586BE8
MKLFQTGKMTQKGQLTFPIALRRELDITEGDRIEVVINESGEATLTVRKKQTLMDVVGILSTDKEIDFDKVRETAQDYVAQNYKHGGNK